MLPRISLVQCTDADYLLFSGDDVISNSLYRTGKWEEHLVQLSMFVLSGTTTPLVLDIGANLGAYSIPLAKKIQGQGGIVFGFEPQRIVYYQLCGNIILNRLDNYFAKNCAVGEIGGEILIPEIDYEGNRNIGAFSLEKKYRELHGIERAMKNKTSSVPVMALDSFDPGGMVSLIKIDVEGFELSVLRGAANFLRRNRFPLILFEAWSFEWFAEQKSDLLSYISELGYQSTALSSTDYMAQHPDHPISIKVTKGRQGDITVERSA